MFNFSFSGKQKTFTSFFRKRNFGKQVCKLFLFIFFFPGWRYGGIFPGPHTERHHRPTQQDQSGQLFLVSPFTQDFFACRSVRSFYRYFLIRRPTAGDAHRRSEIFLYTKFFFYLRATPNPSFNLHSVCVCVSLKTLPNEPISVFISRRRCWVVGNVLSSFVSRMKILSVSIKTENIERRENGKKK